MPEPRCATYVRAARSVSVCRASPHVEQVREQLPLRGRRPELDGRGDPVVGHVHHLDRIAGADRPRFDHAEIRTGRPLAREPLHPAALAQVARERTARDTPRRHLQEQLVADPPALTDPRVAHGEAERGEVLAERAVGQGPASSSFSHASSSSRAYAYTAWSDPPWCRRSHTASPVRPLPPLPLGPGSATRTGPSDGRLPIPVSPSAPSEWGRAWDGRGSR